MVRLDGASVVHFLTLGYTKPLLLILSTVGVFFKQRDGQLLLAGDSAGKAVFPDDADGMWDGHGVNSPRRTDPARLVYLHRSVCNLLTEPH